MMKGLAGFRKKKKRGQGIKVQFREGGVCVGGSGQGVTSRGARSGVLGARIVIIIATVLVVVLILVILIQLLVVVVVVV